MEESVSIWCLKNSPSLFSNSVFAPFFDEDVEEDDDAAKVVAMLAEPDVISDSSHRWARTWQMPSSTSGLRVRYPTKKCIKIVNIALLETQKYEEDAANENKQEKPEYL